MTQLFARELPHDCRRDLFGGAGIVRVWSLLDRLHLPFTAVLACELEPGASVGTHIQEQWPEIVVVLEGSGTALVDGAPRPLASGSVVELPRGSTLAIENGAAVPLRYLIVKSAGQAVASEPVPGRA